MNPIPAIRAVTCTLFLAAAANFLVLVALQSYNLRLGPLHLYASNLFKPLLYLNAAFLVAFYFKSGSQPAERSQQFRPTWLFWLMAGGITAAIYGVSLWINLHFFDWTHRLTTTGRTPFSFFTHRQYDGFYRPLGFCSLWLDNKIFGESLWGYHLQNLVIHVVNGWLAARLASRLGLERVAAQWVGLALIALPGLFEAVIWPGARFDLLAAAFMMFAVERALAGVTWVSIAAYCAAVLSKETGYAFPLLLLGLHLLGWTLPKSKKMAIATVMATAALLATRIAVYGNLGGYPDVQHGGNVNFVLGPKSIAGIFTRLPSVTYLFNTGAGLLVWLRLALAAYVALIAWLLFSSAAPGRYRRLLLLMIVSVLPMINMFGWMTPFAQQGRYLYHPAIWALVPMCAAISQLRYRNLFFTCWIAVMCAGGLFSELVYVRMNTAVAETVSQTVAACQTATCCHAISMRDIPRDWNGAFYFHAEVQHELRRALPQVVVDDSEHACTVDAHVTAMK